LTTEDNHSGFDPRRSFWHCAERPKAGGLFSVRFFQALPLVDNSLGFGIGGNSRQLLETWQAFPLVEGRRRVSHPARMGTGHRKGGG
jgi:hypothetical protein